MFPSDLKTILSINSTFQYSFIHLRPIVIYDVRDASYYKRIIGSRLQWLLMYWCSMYWQQRWF